MTTFYHSRKVFKPYWESLSIMNKMRTLCTIQWLLWDHFIEDPILGHMTDGWSKHYFGANGWWRTLYSGQLRSNLKFLIYADDTQKYLSRYIINLAKNNSVLEIIHFHFSSHLKHGSRTVERAVSEPFPLNYWLMMDKKTVRSFSATRGLSAGGVGKNMSFDDMG